MRGADSGDAPGSVCQDFSQKCTVVVSGLMAASVITILPMFGDYYTNSYLTSGSPRTTMVGNEIEDFLRNSGQPQTGASLVLILMAMLFVLMVYYMVTTIRQQRAAER